MPHRLHGGFLSERRVCLLPHVQDVAHRTACLRVQEVMFDVTLLPVAGDGYFDGECPECGGDADIFGDRFEHRMTCECGYDSGWIDDSYDPNDPRI